MSADKKESETKSKKSEILLIGTFLDAHFRLLAPPIVGAIAGYIADKNLNSSHFWILIGLFLGVLVSIVSIIQLYKKVTN